MCNCKTEIEQKMAAAFMETLPVGSQNLTAELKNYNLLMGGNGELEQKNLAAVKFTYTDPSTGNTKPKKATMTITGNFCMFCGERFGREHAPAS